MQNIYNLKMGKNRNKRFEINETDKGILIAKQLIDIEKEILESN